MANTYQIIARTTVGSGGAANIEFTSIPNIYTDLLVKISHRSSRTGFTVSDTGLQFNSDTVASNYTSRRLFSDGSGAASDSITHSSGYWGYSSAANATANTFTNTEIYIPNYTSSNAKSYSIDSAQENNVSAAYAFFIAGIWTGTAAITTIKLFDANSANFVQYSTATLYGIKNS